MIDPIALKNLLVGLLEAHLGTYTIEELTFPAVAIVPDLEHGYAFPPAGCQITGLEVVIMKPLQGLTPVMGGFFQPSRWDVRIKQWEATGGLIELANSIAPKLAQSPELAHCIFFNPMYLPPNLEKGIIEQVALQFTEYPIA